MGPLLSPRDALSIWEQKHPPAPLSFETSKEDNSPCPLGIRYNEIDTSQPFTSRKPPQPAYTSRKTFDFTEIPRLTKTPWEMERHKRNSSWKRPATRARTSPQVFDRLPREVYNCILEHLEQLHFADNRFCPPCYLRDLCSLTLTSRAWERAATRQMYRKVWLLGHDDNPTIPKARIEGTSRLKLLRRTLRESKPLAKQVREVHMPELQSLYRRASIEREQIVNLVASLVMACPNLERLVGFHVPYTHSFDRLSHALSTRPNLKERVWVMEDADVEDEDEESSVRGYYHAACDPIERFLELNSNHANLSTLVLHQDSARPTIDLTYRAVIGIIRQFPLLRHLSLSGLSSSSFSNLALNALPPNLESLRLENLPGVNEKGLQRLSSSYIVASLKSLTLIDLEIPRLDIIAGFLSPRTHLLESFTFAQHRAPSLYAGLDSPVFESNTLKSIHWEIRSQAISPPSTPTTPDVAKDSPLFPFAFDEPIPCLATRTLATSIKDGLLPALERIRAPHDPQGLLQALCQPLATALLRSDSFFTAPPAPGHTPASSIASHSSTTSSFYPVPPAPEHTPASSLASTPSTLSTPSHSPKDSLDISTLAESRTDSVMEPDAASLLSVSASHMHLKASTTALTPARSRLAAQSRILSARRHPTTILRVSGPDGNVLYDKAFGGYLGDVRSGIVYDVRPDRNRAFVETGDGEDGEVAHEWVVGVEDVVGEWEVVTRGGGGLGRGAVEVGELF